MVDTSASFLIGPLIALAGIGILALILRWAYSTGGSVVARRSRPSTDDDYGLLVPIASPSTYVEGEILRRTLEDAKIKAVLAETLNGPRVMVWPKDADLASKVLKKGR